MEQAHLEKLKAYLKTQKNMYASRVEVYDQEEVRNTEVDFFLSDDTVYIGGDEGEYMTLDELDLIDDTIINFQQ